METDWPGLLLFKTPITSTRTRTYGVWMICFEFLCPHTLRMRSAFSLVFITLTQGRVRVRSTTELSLFMREHMETVFPSLVHSLWPDAGGFFHHSRLWRCASSFTRARPMLFSYGDSIWTCSCGGVKILERVVRTHSSVLILYCTVFSVHALSTYFAPLPHTRTHPHFSYVDTPD